MLPKNSGTPHISFDTDFGQVPHSRIRINFQSFLFVVRVLGYMNRDVNAVRPVGLGHVNIHAAGAQVFAGGIHRVHEHAVILYNSHNDGAGLCTVLFAVEQ